MEALSSFFNFFKNTLMIKKRMKKYLKEVRSFSHLHDLKLAALI